MKPLSYYDIHEPSSGVNSLVTEVCNYFSRFFLNEIENAFLSKGLIDYDTLGFDSTEDRYHIGLEYETSIAL